MLKATIDVNPEVLVWARKTAALTLEEAAKKLSKTKQSLEELEAGDRKPTRATLANMAANYRQPLLVFYLSKPPRQTKRGVDFRKLASNGKQEALLDFLLRNLRVRQEMLRNALEEEEEIEPVDFIGSIKDTSRDDSEVHKVADILRKILGFSVKEFQRKTDSKKAFKYLRECAEKKRVFILLENNLGNYRTNIDVEAFRGFAISDPICPFIVINYKDADSAKSFTLLHEMTHLLFGEAAIINQSEFLNQDSEKIEQFCNKVASELLLPHDELKKEFNFSAQAFHRTDDIESYAEEHNISSAMLAYRLWRLKIISQATLNHFIKPRYSPLPRKDQSATFVDPNGVRRYQNGSALGTIVKQLYADKYISFTKAATILTVKPARLDRVW